MIALPPALIHREFRLPLPREERFALLCVPVYKSTIGRE